jgi:hypothetical protein
MLTVKGLSDQPCFICRSRDKTVEVAFADKTFRGVLCLSHVFEKLAPEVPHVAQGERRSPPA